MSLQLIRQVNVVLVVVPTPPIHPPPLGRGRDREKRKPEEEKLWKSFMGNSSKNCNIAKEKEGCALDGCGKEDAPVME